MAAWGQPDTGSALAAAWGATLSVGSPFGTIRPAMLTMPRFGTAGGIIPAGRGGRLASVGRSLSSYRATPIAIMGRLPGHG
jgi:hypothetical protein